MNDISLLARAMREEPQALSQVVYQWARLRLRGFPGLRLTAEDVVQETWMRALSALEPGPGARPRPDSPCAWLIGIARNIVLEELRRPSAAERCAERTAMPDELRDTLTSLCSALARDELVLRFLSFADGLEEIDRQLLVSCGFEASQPGEVAPRFGIEPASAVRRWHRLRERLRAERLDERLGLYP